MWQQIKRCLSCFRSRNREFASNPAKQQKPRPTLRDMASPCDDYPLVGLSPDELSQACATINNAPEVHEKRIMTFRICPSKCLVVTTGVTYGPLCGHGHHILLQRSETGWGILEVDSWMS